MRSAPWLLAVLAGIALTGPAAQAEELRTPAAPAASAQVPKSGMSMDKVEATYGAPTRRVAAVGEPPITRWEYPGFVVFFEHQLVVHSVVVP
jgi:hypothetical protein